MVDAYAQCVRSTLMWRGRLLDDRPRCSGSRSGSRCSAASTTASSSLTSWRPGSTGRPTTCRLWARCAGSTSATATRRTTSSRARMIVGGQPRRSDRRRSAAPLLASPLVADNDTIARRPVRGAARRGAPAPMATLLRFLVGHIGLSTSSKRPKVIRPEDRGLARRAQRAAAALRGPGRALGSLPQPRRDPGGRRNRPAQLEVVDVLEGQPCR